jgi:hypothetical protein
VSRNALRESWTEYAEKQGLIREPQPAAVVTAAPRKQKYNAVRTTIDGITFASKKEAARYEVLKLRQTAGEIKDLACQPMFPLHVMRLAYNETPIRVTQIGKFTADFSYLEMASGEYKIEDVKGFSKGEAYRLRKKLVEAIHGITITEV